MKQNETLPRIARYLMLHTSHLDNIGLLEGKMGIVIFFSHYSVYANRKTYKLFAEELLDEIYKEIHGSIPYYFNNGLSGIAWGVEYLVRNNFTRGDTNFVLEELDKKILEWDVRYMKDCSLEKGLKGLAYYIISRCSHNADRKIPDSYIKDVILSFRLNSSTKGNNNRIIEKLTAILDHNTVDFDAGFLHGIISNTKIPRGNIFTNKRSLGLLNGGYAGIGLKIMYDDETKSIYS